MSVCVDAVVKVLLQNSCYLILGQGYLTDNICT